MRKLTAQLSPKPRFDGPLPFAKSTVFLFILLSFGVLARFAVMTRGHNFDFDSYQIVVKARHEGLTPWKTNRYNYGPIWSYLLSLFDWITTKTGIGFRLQIVGLLTAADLIIAFFVYRYKGLLLSLLFFLNPISIIVTGFHNQFDNLAIAIVCISILLLKKTHANKFCWMDFLVVFLLGISLATKHTFIFFPLWIALTQSRVGKKIFYVSSPIVIFVITMLPYIESSWSSIKTNVIEYQSFNNAPFWTLIGIADGSDGRLTRLFFIILICLFGFLFRNKPLDEMVFLYCIVMVAFSPAITNQYLAIAAVGAAGLFNAGFFLYLLYGASWLATSTDGLKIVKETRVVGRILFFEPGLKSFQQFEYKTFPVLLIFGLVLHWRRSLNCENNSI